MFHYLRNHRGEDEGGCLPIIIAVVIGMFMFQSCDCDENTDEIKALRKEVKQLTESQYAVVEKLTEEDIYHPPTDSKGGPIQFVLFVKDYLHGDKMVSLSGELDEDTLLDALRLLDIQATDVQFSLSDMKGKYRVKGESMDREFLVLTIPVLPAG